MGRPRSFDDVVVRRFLRFYTEVRAEPWVSNSTPTGTRPLDELAPGARASDPSGFVRAGGEVFFTADDGSGTRGLWALPLRPEGQCGTQPD